MTLTPEAILADLREKTASSFPSLPEVTAEIKFVQEEMAEYVSPAFYMVPAVDNAEENVIYINQGHLPDDLTLFTTLAHEGYPGHLYQNVYYASTDPDPVRSLLSFGATQRAGPPMWKCSPTTSPAWMRTELSWSSGTPLSS